MNEYNKFAAMIASEFHRYLMENEKCCDLMAENTMVIFQVDGEEGFNRWHKESSLRNRERGQNIAYVQLKKWRLHSMIEDMVMTEATA
jgi:hypothetical protein